MTQQPAQLLAAYLVVGTDELKAKRTTERLYARLDEQGGGDFDAQTLDATQELNTAELLDALNTPPLVASFRLIVVKHAERLGKPVSEALITYLEAPMPTTVLLLVAEKITATSRLYKAVAAQGSKALIDAGVKKKSELPQVVRGIAASYRVNMSNEAALRLLDLAGDSTVALNTEVAKLASYVLALGRADVSLDDVALVVSRTNQPSAWDFVEAVSRRQLTTALALLNQMHSETPIGLLSLIVARVRELLIYQALRARKSPHLASELTHALGRKKPIQDWQLRNTEKLAAAWSAPELRSFLAQAAQADARMKTGQDARIVLEELLLTYAR